MNLANMEVRSFWTLAGKLDTWRPIDSRLGRGNADAAEEVVSEFLMPSDTLVCSAMASSRSAFALVWACTFASMSSWVREAAASCSLN